MKTLRTVHEICMVNLPYHNEYVKNFSTPIFTAVMGNRGDKGTPLFQFFHFVPSLAQDISQTFLYFAIKFSKVKDNFISNNSSKYEQKISRNKTVVTFEICRKFVARAKNSQLWMSVIFESHNVDNVIFSIFGKVTRILEKLGLLTNVVWQ